MQYHLLKLLLKLTKLHSSEDYSLRRFFVSYYAVSRYFQDIIYFTTIKGYNLQTCTHASLHSTPLITELNSAIYWGYIRNIL